VGLRTDTVDWDTGGTPLLDLGDHALGLAVRGTVEVVVVDVQLGSWVGGLGSLKGNADEVLTENVVENALAEGTVLVEDLVNDIPGRY